MSTVSGVRRRAALPHRPALLHRLAAPLPHRLAAVLLPILLAGCGPEAEDGAREAEALPPQAQEPPRTAEDTIMLAREIHDRVLTIDTHVDIPFDFATPESDPGVRGRFQNDLPKMREGGLDAAFFIVYHGQQERTPEGFANAYGRAMQKFEGIRRMTETLYPDEIGLAHSADDVERIHAEGRLVALIGVENLYPIGRDLAILEEWHRLGARYASLTHNGHNEFGDAAVASAALGDQGPEWGGLSPLGEAAVDELNRLGIMVDVSHAHRETMMQIVARSRAPVIASHSSIRAVVDHARNLDDDQLRAMRENGGVVQTTALGTFVSADPPATLQDFVDHIDYAVALIGIDHVGISSDFDGGGGVEGWGDASETFNVTLELVRRGYTEEEIRKLWGGNLLRVMREVERVAGEIQATGN